jgi:DNA-binding Xre family transcriptional regulator
MSKPKSKIAQTSKVSGIPAGATYRPLTAQLREMIGSSGMTINGLAVTVGIPQPVLQRFVSGERDDLHLSTADKLCEFFGVRLTAPKARKQTKHKPIYDPPCQPCGTTQTGD